MKVKLNRKSVYITSKESAEMEMIVLTNIHSMKKDSLYVIIERRICAGEAIHVPFDMSCHKRSRLLDLLNTSSINVLIMKEAFAQRVQSADFILFIIGVLMR